MLTDLYYWFSPGPNDIALMIVLGIQLPVFAFVLHSAWKNRNTWKDTGNGWRREVKN